MQRLERWLWAIVMLVLPVSSLPLIAGSLKVQSVAALSVGFLFILFTVWFLPFLFRGGRLPIQTVPILTFGAFAFIASLGSFFMDVPAFREFSRWGTILQNLITLGVGVSAYLMASSWPKSHSDFDFLLRWLNVGGLILILWSTVQGFYTFVRGDYPVWVQSVQNAVSSSGILYPRRVTGLAFEPSWLAHMLNMIYLPWWLAATVRWHSAHPFRILRFSVENILLLGGVAVLIASYSRVGWLAFLLVIAFIILDLSLRLVRWLRIAITRRWKKPFWQISGKTVLPILLFIGVIATYLGMFLGAGLILSKFDPRMKQLFDFKALKEDGLMGFANRLVFAERVVFWQTGYEIFNDHPIMGVGLGNAGYYFPEKMNAFGYGLTEVSQLIFYGSGLPNTKALWSRLAAETGLVGLALFFTWLVGMWVSSRTLEKSRHRWSRTMGSFGLFVVVALIVEGFSVDTFALPYFWLSLGLVTAAFHQMDEDRVETAVLNQSG